MNLSVRCRKGRGPNSLYVVCCAVLFWTVRIIVSFGGGYQAFSEFCCLFYLFTAYSENLVRAPFCKKSSASIRQTPQPPMVWDCNRDEGRYWSCTLLHAPIICRYGRPGKLHKYVKELSPRMCAALLKLQMRATTSSARSKHWFQSHTLVHAPILCICGRNKPIHVSAKLRRPWTCATLSGTCAIGTSALT